jgi:hypothetical protein
MFDFLSPPPAAVLPIDAHDVWTLGALAAHQESPLFANGQANFQHVGALPSVSKLYVGAQADVLGSDGPPPINQ